MGSLRPQRAAPRSWWRRHGLALGFVGVGVAALGVVFSIGLFVDEGVRAYDGAFEEAEFREEGLDGDRSTGQDPLEGLLGPAGVAVLYAEVDSGDVTWVVHADGRVRMTGDADWPDARDAFASWYGGLGLGAPTFEDLRVTTEGGVLEDRSLLL